MNKRFMGILEERRKIREEAINKAREFTEEVRKKLGKITSILIGSYARGDFNEWSDIDIVLISPSFPDNILKRYDLLIDYGIMIPNIELILLKPEEALKLASKKGITIEDAINNGIVLIDDLEIIDELKKLLKS
ncbi:MAG: nucleotidyltransferase domain-containing protein [Nitrososphaerota archaeon]